MQAIDVNNRDNLEGRCILIRNGIATKTGLAFIIRAVPSSFISEGISSKIISYKSR